MDAKNIAAAINTQYRLSNFTPLNFVLDLFLIQGSATSDERISKTISGIQVNFRFLHTHGEIYYKKSTDGGDQGYVHLIFFLIKK